MRKSNERTRAATQRLKAHLGLLVAACFLVTTGYLLGSRAAPSYSQPAAADAEGHAAAAAAATPETVSESPLTALYDAEQRQRRARPRLQIGIAVAVSSRPEHVSQRSAVLKRSPAPSQEHLPLARCFRPAA